MLLALLLLVAFVVFLIAAMWRIFEKAGQPGWAAIIPIYNLYILTQVAGKPGYWTVLMLLPYVGIIWSIWSWNLVSKKFGKDEGFTVGLILLPFIFMPILGFGSAEYEGGNNSTGALDDSAMMS